MKEDEISERENLVKELTNVVRGRGNIKKQDLTPQPAENSLRDEVQQNWDESDLRRWF